MRRTLAIAVLIALSAAGLFIVEDAWIDRARAQDPPSRMTAMPPAEAAATVLLGGFKAVLLDVLWVKADLLFREGRFVELWPVLDLIDTLQPRNPVVQEYLAWHMAWNISLADGPASWRWVRGAIERLERNRPKAPLSSGVLLGRVYFEKCDEAAFPAHAEAVRRWKGRRSLALATEAFQEALTVEGHGPLPALLLASCYERRLEEGPDPETEVRLEALSAYVQKAFPDLYEELENRFSDPSSKE